MRTRAAEFILATALLVVALSPTCAMAGSRVATAEGILEEAQVGLDSCSITVRTAGGQMLVFRKGASLDGLSAADRAEYDRASRSLAGRDFATTVDVNSRVRVYFLPGSGNALVKYVVVKPAPAVFLVIIGSETSSQAAEDKRHRAGRQGFMSDRLQSSEYPPLRPGLWVATAGVFSTEDAAVACRDRARRMGWRDAYVRRLR